MEALGAVFARPRGTDRGRLGDESGGTAQAR